MYLKTKTTAAARTCAPARPLRQQHWVPRIPLLHPSHMDFVFCPPFGKLQLSFSFSASSCLWSYHSPTKSPSVPVGLIAPVVPKLTVCPRIQPLRAVLSEPYVPCIQPLIWTLPSLPSASSKLLITSPSHLQGEAGFSQFPNPWETLRHTEHLLTMNALSSVLHTHLSM